MTEENTQPSNNFIRNRVREDLADGKTTLMTRFPPEPNGYLHIGHAKSICLNFGIAEEFKGKCNLRFDDTNPEKEDQEYVQSIKNDVTWLGYKWNELEFASNYFEQLYQYAVKLIELDKAYVCHLNAEQVREYRLALHQALRQHRPGPAGNHRADER